MQVSNKEAASHKIQFHQAITEELKSCMAQGTKDLLFIKSIHGTTTGIVQTYSTIVLLVSLDFGHIGNYSEATKKTKKKQTYCSVAL